MKRQTDAPAGWKTATRGPDPARVLGVVCGSPSEGGRALRVSGVARGGRPAGGRVGRRKPAPPTLEAIRGGHPKPSGAPGIGPGFPGRVLLIKPPTCEDEPRRRPLLGWEEQKLSPVDSTTLTRGTPSCILESVPLK
ncbi:hypothetical protein Srut_13250 [Streptomyces rutgersensis]|nr:hypothetical protein Srut_13250 [Streptomyces rutgersensis]